jgi:hypothetical protein
VLTVLPRRRRGTLGRYRGGPPGGIGVRGSARTGFPRPCRKITLPFAVTPLALTPTVTFGRDLVTGRRPDRNRPGIGRLSGRRARLSALRCGCGLPEKLSPPEHDSGGEGDRRENAHGDRQVDQAQVAR